MQWTKTNVAVMMKQQSVVYSNAIIERKNINV